MKTFSLPKTKIGRISFGLACSYLILLALFFLFMLFGAVTFDTGHWWDWILGISILLMILSFFTGLIAMFKEKCFWIYASMFINVCAILFLLLHSLFIND